MQYEDFIIQIGPDRGEGHTVTVLSSPAGEGEGVLRLPSSAWRFSQNVGDLARSLEQTRDSRLSDDRELDEEDSTASGMTDEAPEEFGSDLFRALFSGQVLSLFDQSLGILRSRPDRGLRIKLKLNPKQPELAQLTGLPWEFLHRQETGDFLSLSRSNPFVRYLDVPRPSRPPALPAVLRILLVISSPLEYRQLDLLREWREIEAAFQHQPLVEVSLLSQASLAELRRAVLTKPVHVLHIMGHGGFAEQDGEGVLYFEGHDRRAVPVSGRTLATQLNDCRDLRLVLLNACNTARAGDADHLNPFAGVATALVSGGLPAVVAMQYPISDPAAIAFSQAFYQRLAVGDPADAAVVEGRLAIRRSAPRSVEWGTPVLFMRSPDGQLFAPPTVSVEDETTTETGTFEEAISWLRPEKIRRLAVAFVLLLGLGLGAWLLSQMASPKPSIEETRVKKIDANPPAETPPEDAALPDHVPPEQSGAAEDPVGQTESGPRPVPPTVEEEMTTEPVRPRGKPDDGTTDVTQSTPLGEGEKKNEGETKDEPAEPPALTLPVTIQTPPPTQTTPPPTAPPRKAPQPSGTRVLNETVTGMRFRHVTHGAYVIGSPSSEPHRNSNEDRHSVRLTHGFWIAETEVTQKQWLDVIGTSPSYFQGNPERPVESVTWYEAIEFANRLSQRAHLSPCYDLRSCRPDPSSGRPVCPEIQVPDLDCQGYRLPTEAEWEVAARAGSSDPFHTGSTLDRSQASYDGLRPYPGASPKDSVSTTEPVRRYPANPWHLYGMHGNVKEWTWDRFARNFSGETTNPTGPKRGQERTLRGGGYQSPAKDCRSAAREGLAPSDWDNDIGFRLVRTAR